MSKPPKVSNFRLFDLNPQQEQAVRTIEGPVLILAGAGTGKTRVITARIAYMIAQGITPADILAVTFTNKAAREMKERLGGMIEESEAKRVTMSTFHSLCVRILRQDIVHLGYKENFTIYDQSDQISLLRKIITRISAADEKLEPNLANSLISKAKSEFGDPMQASVLVKNELLRDVFVKYQTELKRLNAVDFDDLLLLTVRLLIDNEERRAYWQNRFKYVMVDEFQDTNRLQLELVARLVGTKAPNVCAVGDDDQSIYSWRGAEVSNILDFERHFPNPLIVKLEQNYRSTNSILSTANGLIKNNPRRRPKSLWSDHGDGEKIRLIPLPDDKQEAEYVVAEIQKRSFADTIPWEKFAIIYRMNAQSRLMETNLRALKIPYQLVGGKSFFDRREVKDYLCYLRMLVNPDDDISLLRILNTPPRGISDATSEKALQHSIATSTSMYKALADPTFHRQIPTKAAVAVSEFFTLLDAFETKLYAFQAVYADVMEEFLTQIGYWDDLRRSCKTSDEADEREKNVKEMLEAFREYQKSTLGEPKDYLDTMTLDDDWMKSKKDKEQKGVMLITMHAAKGLEYPHVYIIGIEEGVLPHSRSQLEGTVDEERRLFYVGITRAQKTLALTYCLNRLKWGQASPCNPSSFLKELPMQFIEAVDYNQVLNAPAEEKVAKASFSRLKDMLRE